ncbi:MAG TPA: peptidase, partial [Methanospirillum sp.]|nr:peptidase [Methanospirillum sp.]
MEQPLARISCENEIHYQIRIQELEAQNLELSIRSEELIKENSVLKRENSQLKRMPLFVALVVDVFKNGEIYLRQMGNNQEYVTQITDELRPYVYPGCKVAVNNALSVVKVLEETYDSRVRVMELDESPDVTFEHIGGLSSEIEEIREAVEYPLTMPEVFERIGV